MPTNQTHPVTAEQVAAALRAAADALDPVSTRSGDESAEPKQVSEESTGRTFADKLASRRASQVTEGEGEAGGAGPALRPRPTRPRSHP